MTQYFSITPASSLVDRSAAKIDETLRGIDRAINKANDDLKTAITYNVQGLNTKIIAVVESQLKIAGYAVKYEKESDPRDHSSWEYLAISW